MTTTNNVVWGIPKQFGYFVLRQDARWRATEASSSTRLGWQCGRHNRRKPGHRPGYRTTLGASRWGQRSGTLTNVPAEVAEYWERHGWVTVVDDKPAAKPKAEPKPEPASEKK